MFRFIKEALSEFDHVVWPTPTETKKYMLYTVGTIVVVGVLLAVSDYLLRSGLQAVRDQFPHDNTEITSTVSGEDSAATPDDIKKITEQLEAQKANQSSGVTLSGSAQ